MRSIEQLMDAAKRHSKIEKDKDLAENLGRSATHMSNWRTRRSYATDPDIVKLAKLAGISPTDALAQHALWKHQDKPEVASAYKAIVDALKSSAAALLLLGVFALPDAGTKPVHSAVFAVKNIHYATTRLLKSLHTMAWIQFLTFVNCIRHAHPTRLKIGLAR